MPSIDEFKQQLLTSSSLHEVWCGFMDFIEQPRLSSEQEALDFSRLKKHHPLHQMLACIEKIARDFLEKPVKLKKPMLCHIAGKSLYHGFCVCNSEPLFLFYFSDLETGLFMLNGLSKKQDYFRFKIAKRSSKTTTH